MPITLIAIVIVVASIAFMRGYSSPHDAKRSNAGWYGLGLLALLFVGLWGSVQAGNEPAAYGFGIAITLALPGMLLVGISAAVGRAMRKRKETQS